MTTTIPTTEQLELLKALLQIEGDAQDRVLEFLLDRAVDQVLNFTNRTYMTDDLWNATWRMIVEMAMGANKIMAASGSIEGDDVLDSVRVGGVQVTSGSNKSALMALDAMINDGIKKREELYKFRSVFRVARSANPD